MRRNDFSEMFMEKILRRVRHDFSLENLENIPALEAKVLEWIGEGIKIYHPLKYLEKESKVFIIVGPTGVGKTTTIAKLAAANGVGNNQLALRRVKIVTIDNYRIAARRQIETYAEIMRIPVACAESGAEFKKVLALSEDMDLILVDTIGKSPRDLSKLAEMKEILDAAGSSSETHLAVSATTKASDVEEILKQFEPFRYKAIILTKLDETMRVGNIISVLVMANKPISYIADGQGVPQDIEEASVVRLLMNLDGFRIDREQIEEKFGKREKITDKYWS
ncbi:Signal recognition particle receptor FtsY [subsurface metagenome]